MLQRTPEQIYRVGHLFCGLGAGAKGFNDARFGIRGLSGRFECAGGVDNDPGAIANFELLTGVRGTILDLFDEEQYRAFHGKAPPTGWRPAMPADIRAAHGGRVDVMFLSAPCKGFSGLLSAAASGTDKYQALNRLTLRGVWLSLEAYKDDPVRIYVFENVPRIGTRGRPLLEQIKALFRADGYVVTESEHDCGELGGLGQSRRRFLLVARRIESVPNFLYEPEKKRLRGVGEIIGKLPLPADPIAGAMHRVPMLQWKTWVRLAFVPAGRDWRALNELRIVDGNLADFGIVPDQPLRNDALGVNAWDAPAHVVTAARAPGQGRFSVADPRMGQAHNETLGVRGWGDPARVVAAASRPANGAHSVADPRDPDHGPIGPGHVCKHGVRWPHPCDGCDVWPPHPVPDPRPTQANQSFAQYGVKPWGEAAATVSGQSGPGGGPHSVADPRMHRAAFNNVFRIVAYESHALAAGGRAVADPRPPASAYDSRKYSDGAFAVADPRARWGENSHRNKLKVIAADQPAGTITGSDRVGSGALSVADPRTGLAADRAGYQTQGHYGVQPWSEPSLAVPGFAKHDRGRWSVADPRDQDPEPLAALPGTTDRLVARIVARDGTWHRPFTTLELAALQSLFDPEEIFRFEEQQGRWTTATGFDLIGGSDATKREWIGNAVPSASARGMAETIGETLLLADMGETFTLSSRAIWVKPLALALATDPRQQILGEAL